MILDVARHKFSEALLTLLIVAVVVLVVALSLLDGTPLPIAEGSGIAPLRPWLDSLAVNYPTLSAIAITLLFFGAVLRLARATIRTSLYPASTMAAVSLLAIVLMPLVISPDCVTLIAIVALMAEALGRLLGCFGPTMRLHRLFTAMLALGTLPLIDGSLLATTLLLTILAISVRGTLRESIVIITGVLLPAFTYCYISWLLGGEFMEAATLLATNITLGAPRPLLATLDIAQIIFLAILLILHLFTTTYYITDRMSLALGVRTAWSSMQIALLGMVAAFALLPSTSEASIIVVAMLITTMLPLLFQRLTIAAAVVAYTLLSIAAIVAVVL